MIVSETLKAVKETETQIYRKHLEYRERSRKKLMD